MLSLRWKCEHILSVELIRVPRKRQNNNQLCVAFKSFEIELEDTYLCPLEYRGNRSSFRVLRILRNPDLSFLPTLHTVRFRLNVISSYGVLSRWRFACAQTEPDQHIFSWTHIKVQTCHIVSITVLGLCITLAFRTK